MDGSDLQPLHHISARQCAAVARELLDCCAHFEIRPAPGSDLDVMIRDLAWAGTFDGIVLSESGAAGADRDRAVRVFLLHEQARRVAASLTMCRQVGGAESKVRAVRKRIDRLRTQWEPAQDTLFELELAGRLAVGHAQVTLEEPDIVLRHELFDPIAIACKRPRNRARLRERLTEASTQIRDTAMQGVIAIGIEPIIHDGGHPTKPAFFESDSPEEFWRSADHAVDALFLDVASDAARALRSGVCGILFCGMITGISKHPTAFVWRWAVRVVPNLAFSNGALMTELLRRGLTQRFGSRTASAW